MNTVPRTLGRFSSDYLSLFGFNGLVYCALRALRPCMIDVRSLDFAAPAVGWEFSAVMLRFTNSVIGMLAFADVSPW